MLKNADTLRARSFDGQSGGLATPLPAACPTGSCVPGCWVHSTTTGDCPLSIGSGQRAGDWLGAVSSTRRFVAPTSYSHDLYMSGPTPSAGHHCQKTASLSVGVGSLQPHANQGVAARLPSANLGSMAAKRQAAMRRAGLISTQSQAGTGECCGEPLAILSARNSACPFIASSAFMPP